MKYFTHLIAGFFLLGLASCQKDRECVCTSTYTSSSGNVSTQIDQKITYIDVTKSEAKSICQKSTMTKVNENGATSTTVNDCKLQ